MTRLFLTSIFIYLLININYIILVNASTEENISGVGSTSKKYCHDTWNSYEYILPSRLIGGLEELKDKFPYMAALGYGKSSDITWRCGGTLISPKYVMTAAHCTDPPGLDEVKSVRLGVVILGSNPDPNSDETLQDINVVKVIRHPDYRPKLVYNDIALLELASPAKLTEGVRPACLHTETEIKATQLLETGWTKLRHNDSYPLHLQELSMKMYSHEECNTVYGSNNPRLNRGIDNGLQICAGDNSTDTCHGVSGSPLQIHNPDYPATYSVIGITSFGKLCQLTDATPGVYTRVSHYIEWIESIVWKDNLKTPN